ncbi:ABC transporter substrate-binding protein [Paenibacillus sp. IB182496]|uniref:ABC transporter substrate-binding protein n=2 Tax=Paenibacillus sabuli TaxID=2772509 RepID=A0A927BTR4_9BACL|nr:ABC transporter substrate-binding protein [Paenibacillus sabuli]
MLALALLLLAAACSSDNGDAANNGATASNGANAGGGNTEANNQNAGSGEDGEGLTPVRVVLDWTPNTNHTGLYVARDKGFFAEQGLEVEIMQPGEGNADTMVATGDVEFGVSYQEGVTQGRVNGVPLVSLAAVIQHNTSGFASPVDKQIETPADFEGMTYGGWGSPIDAAVIESLMQEVEADYSKVNIVNIGNADFFTAVKRDIDFAWIYYAWTGVEAELKGEELNVVYLTDYSDKLDYYTPVLVTNEDLIQDNPDIVQAFVAGAAQGYQYAIDHPADAAEVLIAAEPDLNAELVRASQEWLSPRYQDDAPRWGEQSRDVWAGYADWMFEHELLEQELDVDAAFTNDYLPQ